MDELLYVDSSDKTGDFLFNIIHDVGLIAVKRNEKCRPLDGLVAILQDHANPTVTVMIL